MDHFNLAALSQLRDLARTHLRGTLAGRRHEPSAGLLLAFLGMYESVQGQINGFTDRHVDFYYQRCLGFRARPAQADHVNAVQAQYNRGDAWRPGGASYSAHWVGQSFWKSVVSTTVSM